MVHLKCNFNAITAKLERERQYYPSLEEAYTWIKKCSIETTFIIKELEKAEHIE